MQFSKEKDAKFSDSIFLKKSLLVENKFRALCMQKNALPSILITVNYFIGSYHQASDILKHTQEQGPCPTGYISLATHLTMLSVSTTASIFFAMNNNKNT